MTEIFPEKIACNSHGERKNHRIRVTAVPGTFVLLEVRWHKSDEVQQQ
jgi:hypothetical protein